MDEAMKIHWIRWYPSGEEEAVGSEIEMLIEIVDQQPGQMLPPFKVLDDIVRRGKIGGGMGGGLSWSNNYPELGPKHYAELAALIPSTRRPQDCDSTTFEEWIAWNFKKDHRIDYQEHLRLLKALREADLNMEHHPSQKNQEDYLKASTEYTVYINRQLTNGVPPI